jgi:hypothetical protein
MMLDLFYLYKSGSISKSISKYYVLMYKNGKMRPVETVWGMGVG